MKRVVYARRGGLEAIEIVEEEDPTPTADQVRIEVHRAGINFADLMMRQGLYGAAPDFPFTPGYEVSGIVREVGENVEDFAVGDRVVAFSGFGGYAEQVVVDTKQVWPLPESISFDAAAAMPVTYLTAHHMLVYLGNFKPGDSILVHHAAGGVGTATAQLARALEAGSVYGTASANKAEFVESQGMIHIPRGEDFAKRIKSEIGGVHHALDPVGGKHIMDSYRALRNGGRLYVFGASSAVKGPKRSMLKALKMWWDTPRFDPIRMMNSNKSVYGIHMGMWKDEDVVRKQMVSLAKMLELGHIDPVIDSVYRFEDVAAAQQHIHDRGNRGKVLLDFSPK
ncbi:MAG: medium chain dehydrogenase/reductase family protein [Candidatus Poseidoniales archaeon]|nr:medium chain dehydrogenase/reductase family protein [Candidatus Poseidoniales archaeon]